MSHLLPLAADPLTTTITTNLQLRLLWQSLTVLAYTFTILATAAMVTATMPQDNHAIMVHKQCILLPTIHTAPNITD